MTKVYVLVTVTNEGDGEIPTYVYDNYEAAAADAYAFARDNWDEDNGPFPDNLEDAMEGLAAGGPDITINEEEIRTGTYFTPNTGDEEE